MIMLTFVPDSLKEPSGFGLTEPNSETRARKFSLLTFVRNVKLDAMIETSRPPGASIEYAWVTFDTSACLANRWRRKMRPHIVEGLRESRIT